MYFENLYSSNHPKIEPSELSELEQEFLSNPNIKKIRQLKKILCDRDITLEECSIAVQKLSNNRDGPRDGLPVDFYKFFWNKLKCFEL